jgi:outer membrane protein assembly factor BamB
MDYESRKVKWYWLLLFILYCLWVVNQLFKGNPLLYSKSDLRSSLNGIENSQPQPLPLHPAIGKLSNSTFFARYNWARSAIDPLGSPRSKNYSEYEHLSVDLGLGEKVSVQTVASDSSGFFLTSKNQWALAVSLDGNVRWKYHFKEWPAERGGLFQILLDETSAFLVTPLGEVVCLDKISGEVRWLLDTKLEIVAAPLLWKKNLLVPSQTGNGLQLTEVDRLTGQLASESHALELKPGFQLSYSAELNAMIATVDNKVIALDPEEWQIQWSQTLTDPIKGYAVSADGAIYVATLGAKVVKLDGARKGKVEWEADLPKPPASPPTYIPVVNRLSVMDSSGGISLIDVKTGKTAQHFATENHNPLVDVWSARLKGQFIEEFKMDWLQKGWTIWTPCYENAFCIFTPNKGLQVQRTSMSGRPLALPLAFGRHWVFLVENKAGQYFLSHHLEESEIKKLHNEKPSP